MQHAACISYGIGNSIHTVAKVDHVQCTMRCARRRTLLHIITTTIVRLGVKAVIFHSATVYYTPYLTVASSACIQYGLAVTMHCNHVRPLQASPPTTHRHINLSMVDLLVRSIVH